MGIVGALQELEEEKRAIEENPSLVVQDSTVCLMKYMHHLASKKRKLNA
jgi:hypothetical protein